MLPVMSWSYICLMSRAWSQVTDGVHFCVLFQASDPILSLAAVRIDAKGGLLPDTTSDVEELWVAKGVDVSQSLDWTCEAIVSPASFGRIQS